MREEIYSFFWGLRNFVQHVKTPNIIANVKHTSKKNGVVYSTYFNRDEILSGYNSWQNKAKFFIKNQSELIDIKGIVLKYFKLMNDFYEWLVDKLVDYHRDDFKKVEEKRKEYNKEFFKHVPDLLKSKLLLHYEINNEPEHLFVNIVPHKIYYEVLSKFDNTSDRLIEFLKYIEQHITLEDDLKSEIGKAFENYITSKKV